MDPRTLFGSGDRTLPQFVSGSELFHMVTLAILGEKKVKIVFNNYFLFEEFVLTVQK